MHGSSVEWCTRVERKLKGEPQWRKNEARGSAVKLSRSIYPSQRYSEKKGSKIGKEGKRGCTRGGSQWSLRFKGAVYGMTLKGPWLRAMMIDCCLSCSKLKYTQTSFSPRSSPLATRSLAECLRSGSVTGWIEWDSWWKTRWEVENIQGWKYLNREQHKAKKIHRTIGSIDVETDYQTQRKREHYYPYIRPDLDTKLCARDSTTLLSALSPGSSERSSTSFILLFQLTSHFVPEGTPFVMCLLCLIL